MAGLDRVKLLHSVVSSPQLTSVLQPLQNFGQVVVEEFQ